MRIRTASLSLLAAGLVAVGCSSDESSPDAADPTTVDSDTTAGDADVPAETAGEPASGPTITIEGFAFSSIGEVAAGTEIVVENLDGSQHTLTADDGSFDTGGLDGNATTTIVAPDAPGTYTFVCNIHPAMAGSLTVSG